MHTGRLGAQGATELFCLIWTHLDILAHRQIFERWHCRHYDWAANVHDRVVKDDLNIGKWRAVVSPSIVKSVPSPLDSSNPVPFLVLGFDSELFNRPPCQRRQTAPQYVHIFKCNLETNLPVWLTWRFLVCQPGWVTTFCLLKSVVWSCFIKAC